MYNIISSPKIMAFACYLNVCFGCSGFIIGPKTVIGQEIIEQNGGQMINSGAYNQFNVNSGRLNNKPLILSGFQEYQAKCAKCRLCPIISVKGTIPAMT
jgi:hypothetical protein